MFPANSKFLIIDASVAMSASAKKSFDKQSHNCRRFLEDARDICHCMVTSDYIVSEWIRHQSSWTFNWAIEMKTLRKEFVANPSILDELREKLEDFATTRKDMEAISKDFPYIETALSVGGIIVSSDDTARRFYSKAASFFPELKEVMWVNPKRNLGTLLVWLANGALTTPEYLLGG